MICIDLTSDGGDDENSCEATMDICAVDCGSEESSSMQKTQELSVDSDGMRLLNFIEKHKWDFNQLIADMKAFQDSKNCHKANITLEDVVIFLSDGAVHLKKCESNKIIQNYVESKCIENGNEAIIDLTADEKTSFIKTSFSSLQVQAIPFTLHLNDEADYLLQYMSPDKSIPSTIAKVMNVKLSFPLPIYETATEIQATIRAYKANPTVTYSILSSIFSCTTETVKHFMASSTHRYLARSKIYHLAYVLFEKMRLFLKLRKRTIRWKRELNDEILGYIYSSPVN